MGRKAQEPSLDGKGGPQQKSRYCKAQARSVSNSTNPYFLQLSQSTQNSKKPLATIVLISWILILMLCLRGPDMSKIIKIPLKRIEIITDPGTVSSNHVALQGLNLCAFWHHQTLRSHPPLEELLAAAGCPGEAAYSSTGICLPEPRKNMKNIEKSQEKKQKQRL